MSTEWTLQRVLFCHYFPLLRNIRGRENMAEPMSLDLLLSLDDPLNKQTIEHAAVLAYVLSNTDSP